MRITSKGQVTIPQDVRRRAGLLPGTDVDFAVEHGVVTIKKAAKRGKKPTRGEQLVAALRGSATIKMTTEEIMELTRGPYDDVEPQGAKRNDPGRLKRPHRRRAAG